MNEISSPNLSFDWKRDRMLWLLIGLAALLGLAYNFVLIIGLGPDEVRHMNYVKLLLDEHRLPFMLPGGETEYRGAHAYHAPLYYVLLSPFYALSRGLGESVAWHFTRLISMGLCVAALPLIYQIAQRVGGYSSDGRAFARLVVAQVALLPILGMTSGIINNDSALLFFVVLFLWLLGVKYSEDWSLKSAFVLGLCFGAGALCKGTALLCDGAALIFYLLAQNSSRNSQSAPSGFRLRQAMRLTIVLVASAAICGPWYLRNRHLYGTFQPIPRGFAPSDLGWLPRPQYGVLVQMMHPHFPSLFGEANWGMFYSMWSQKDWIPETLRAAIYALLAVYSLAALASGARRSWSQRAKVGLAMEERSEASTLRSADEIEMKARPARWSAYAAFVVSWLACLHIALFVHWGQAEGGRYLLPAFVGFSIFLARGWQGWLGYHETGARRLKSLTLAWCVSMLALNLLCIYWLIFYLNPLARSS